MNFKKYHVSRNLWDGTYKDNWGVDVSNRRVYITSNRFAITIPVDSNTDYTISRSEVGGSTYFVYGLSSEIPNDNTVFEYCDRFDYDALSQTVNSQKCNYLTIFFGAALSPDIMVNIGSTALPYEPYSSEVWHDTPHYIHYTSTDTITTLPAVIYTNDTSVTVEITGNTGGVGDLVESGEHAGEYVIPIINNGVTTNIYNATALDISDSLTTTIPTIAGASTLSIGTTIQPSEITATYKGWHPVADVHERINGAWT